MVADMIGFLGRSIVQDPSCESYPHYVLLKWGDSLNFLLTFRRSVPALALFANSL